MRVRLSMRLMPTAIFLGPLREEGEDAVAHGKVERILFDLPDRPMTKEERIAMIKRMIQDKEYVTKERLDAAIDRLIDEIDKD